MEDINQIKLALVKSKKTNKWLAEQLKVNSTTFLNGVLRRHSYLPHTLKKIAGLLNIPVSELIVSE